MSVPLPEHVRSRAWPVAAVALLTAVAFAFHQPIRDMIQFWIAKPDYSHGFFVLPVSLYLLWRRRDRIPQRADWPDARGLPLILIGLAMSVYFGLSNIAKELAQGVGLILALTGVVVILFGRYGLRWAWPGLLYLIFMVKWPDALEIQFTFKLRQAATHASNFLLQLFGYPSYIGGQQGTVITVGEVRLGVEWACSGLSMVLTFLAVAAAFALIVKRPLADRLFILASALPIAVLSNVIRITLTSLVYIAGWQKLGDLIIHDLAGWLMMPLALGFMALELKILDWLFTIPVVPNRDEIIKRATKTAAANWTIPADAQEATDAREASR